MAEVYGTYELFAMAHDYKVCSREKLGQALHHLFDDVDVIQLTVDKEKGYWYKGLQMRDEAVPVKSMDEIVLGECAHAEYKAPNFILQVFTRYEVDDVPLKVIIDLNTNTNAYTMMVNGYEINPVQEYGYHGHGRLTQNWITGMTLALRRQFFCQGMDILVKPGSKVTVARGWKDNYQLFSLEMMRWHSHNCRVLLSITKNNKTEACRKCTHDLK